MNTETEGHKNLKEKIYEIFYRLKFKVDMEVDVKISVDNHEEDRSFDVIAYKEFMNKRILIAVECKDTDELRNSRDYLNSWEKHMQAICEGDTSIVIKKSSKGEIKQEWFENLDYCRLIFAFTEKLYHSGNYNNVKGIIESRKFIFWDYYAVEYYLKISEKILEVQALYELLRELDVNPEADIDIKAPIIKINQGSRTVEMYTTTLHPGVLLKLGYVYRRRPGLPDSYQRIPKLKRISNISEFIETSKDPIKFANSIILVLDEDVAEKIDIKDNIIKIPLIYKSALIVDGQHRILGFLGTQYEEWIPGKEKEFQIPVTIIKGLDTKEQLKMFVTINYNQKKIDPSLYCDLATSYLDLKFELTWASLLVKKLSEMNIFKGKIKIRELDKNWSISISSFARYALNEYVLGYEGRKKEYKGPLYNLYPFDVNKDFNDLENKRSFGKHIGILYNYFKIVKNVVGDEKWENHEEYGITRTIGINGLLLVLYVLLLKYEENTIKEIIENDLLNPIKNINFNRKTLKKYGTGWQSFKGLANDMKNKIEKDKEIQLPVIQKPR